MYIPDDKVALVQAITVIFLIVVKDSIVRLLHVGVSQGINWKWVDTCNQFGAKWKMHYSNNVQQVVGMCMTAARKFFDVMIMNKHTYFEMRCDHVVSVLTFHHRLA